MADWSKLWNEIITMEPGMIEICLRLACAMLVGLVIGTEREYTHRPAGMRTHILVCLGACVVAINSELLFHEFRALGATPDPARLGAQVITGVGFLGAGTIMREGTTVKGLTTAASVWAVACLGLAAGSGYYFLSLAGMVFIFVTLTLFEFLQHRLMKQNVVRRAIEVETEDISQTLKLLYRYADESHTVIENLEVDTLEKGFRIRFDVENYGRRGKSHSQKFMEKLVAEKGVVKIRQKSAV